MLSSKVYESFVLSWTLSQVEPQTNQYGGTKGCSSSHLLVSVWQNILRDLEDCRASTLLTAIDYAKAFNRMQFQECLRSLARHRASSEIIALVATFLTDQFMSVRVGNCWSVRRPVYGGVPQGSILAVLLFNITTDNLEDRENAIGFNGTEGNRRLGADAGVEDSADDSPDRSEENLTSTLISSTQHDFEPGITPFRNRGSDFVFLDRARNVRRAIDLDPDLTVLRDQTLPPEPNPVTSATWRPRPTSKHKYIDDGLMDTKLNMETVAELNGERDKHALDCQNLFRRVIRNAELIGMKANREKTNLLCISDSLTFKAKAHIFTTEGARIQSKDNLKLLGFHFSDRPTCTAQVEAIRKSFRGRYWLLIHMGQHHYTKEELLKAYKTMVRPIAEYCSVVFHPMLTDRQDEQIERLQATALRYIYGFGIPYAKMREMSGLATLRQRRIEACDKFAQKCLSSPRFQHWFPKNESVRRSRHSLEYKEEYARCDRLKNSTIFYLRRRLNGKQGKTYGQRYRHYRDAGVSLNNGMDLDC